MSSEVLATPSTPPPEGGGVEPLCLAELADAARARLPEAVWHWLVGGAGEGATLAANEHAWRRWELWSRPLIDFAAASTAVALLDRQLPLPILPAPIAHLDLVHPGGDLALAEAVWALRVPAILPTLAGVSLEEFAHHGEGPRWFQLYFQPERAVTADLVRRAREADCEVILVTVDAPVAPLPRAAQRAGFAPPAGPAPNLVPYPPPPRRALPPGASPVFAGPMMDAPTWADLAWLCRTASIPVLVKGILHPDDARRALAAGAAGVVVSNHGGRTLDGAPATAVALPRVREALGPGVPILVDGGIRSGADVFRALALGADAVLVGRPLAWGLAWKGALGAARTLALLARELEIAMALAGCPERAAIGPHCLYHPEG